jgi:hypothetical protein
MACGYGHAHEATSSRALELQILPHQVGGLGTFLNFIHGVSASLVGWEKIVNGLSVRRRDGVLLNEVAFLHDAVGVLA